MSQPTQADPRGPRPGASTRALVLAGLPLHVVAGSCRGYANYLAPRRLTPVGA